MGIPAVLLEPDDDKEPQPQFLVGLEPQLISYVFDFPDEVQNYLAQVKPEYFEGGPETFVIGGILDYYAKYAVVPTREALWSVLSKQLLVDDPWEEVEALIKRESNPRETPHVKASFSEWLRYRAYKQLHSDVAAAALERGDYATLHKILDDAKGVGVSQSTTQITIDELLDKIVDYDWIVEGVLLRDQPCTVAASAKTMKTSVCLDLAISVASGTKFLGRHKCHQAKVLFYSGESGRSALHNQATAIINSRGISREAVSGNLTFDATLPKLTSPTDLAAMQQAITKGDYKLVIIDPIYVALGGNVSPTQVFEMGPVLAGVNRACQEAGATLILVHHFNRRSAIGSKPTLADLSGAGMAEFCRQHILLSRRRPYESNGHHDLWMVAGREGSSECTNLVIDEGTLNNRRWEVEIFEGNLEIPKQDKKEKRLLGKAEEVVAEIRAILEAGGEPTLNKVKIELAISGKTARKILDFAVQEGLLEVVTKGSKTLFLPVSDERDGTFVPVVPSRCPGTGTRDNLL